jgi:hypothetical protein
MNEPRFEVWSVHRIDRNYTATFQACLGDGTVLGSFRFRIEPTTPPMLSFEIGKSDPRVRWRVVQQGRKDSGRLVEPQILIDANESER